MEPDGLNTKTGDRSISYKDKRGRLVLSQQQNQSGSELVSTYYIYDDKDRVRTILPPAVTVVTSPLAYQYLYDGANNVTHKFIPDMGWSEMLYDDRNLLTARRDSNLIYENKWLSSINDDYGRVVQTGFHDIGQSGVPNPNAPNINHLLTETFYDKTCGQTADQYIGKVCHTRSRILGTSDWLEDNITYDIFGRMIYSEGNNHLDLTVGSEKDSLYYDYADNRTRIRRTHQAFGNTQTIIERTHFDHVGRVENTYHKYNVEAEEWLTNNAYTIKDELETKKMGVSNGAINYLEQVDYDYLPNRFLTEMSGNLFDFALIYDNIDPAYNATPYKNGNIATQIWQVQGKEAQFYNYQYDFLNRLTQADYKSITSTGSIDPNNHYSTGYSYDPRGNILTLNREGQLPNTSFGPIDNLDYDYHSTSNQLKTIADLTTGTGLEKGFKPGLGGDYLYDENGNLSYDPHKGLTIHYNFLNLPDTVTNSVGNTIVWLYDATGIKLQKKVVSAATGDVFINDNPIPSNTYYGDKITSAGVIPNSHIVRFEAGQQIKLQTGFKGKGQFAGLTGVTGGLSTTTQDYCNSIEYKNGTLEAIFHTEGRIHFIDATIRYEYVLHDHLGNTRIMFADKNGNGAIDASTEILQENHYYPFGMAQGGSWTSNTSNLNDYLYNGKELDTDFGLNWYHYGARMYDPTIGGFTGIDPLSETFSYQSPYNYADNNPIKFIDFMGLGSSYNWNSGRYEDEDGKEVSWNSVKAEYGVDGEYEKNENGDWVKVSNKGDNIGVDFYHQENGNTRVTDRQGNWNTITKGRYVLSGEERGHDITWQNLFGEFIEGTGPERSLFIGTGSMSSLIQEINFFSEKLAEFNNSGKPKAPYKYWFGLGIENALSGNIPNRHALFMGSFNFSFYKLGNRTLSIVQDNKSRASNGLFHSRPSYSRSEGAPPYKSLQPYPVTPSAIPGRILNETNIYQTYIFFTNN